MTSDAESSGADVSGERGDAAENSGSVTTPSRSEGTAGNKEKRGKKAVREAKRVLARPAATLSLGERLSSLAEQAAAVYDLSSPIDTYGDGVVADLERRVAQLLGKEDAAFFPTGTMAQQVVLRCWAERTGNNRVVLHPLSHPEVFEANAFERVSGLYPVRATGAPRQPTAEEIRGLPESFGALMLELPLRDAGYLLPTWDELVGVTEAARERGAVVHFDGARLWECTTHFGRPLEEIAALADTVYVSFYKSLDGISGAAVAGPRSLIEETRIWRHRYGGRVVQQFPAALSALVGLERELPRLPEYVAHARLVAAAMAEGFRDTRLGWFKVRPEVPHTHQFQVWLPFAAETLEAAVIRQAEESGIALFQSPWWEPGVPPGIALTEVTVSAAGLEWTPADVRAAVCDFVRHVETSPVT
ncbi:threonine aldolase [Streptosporangium becharense]|uniref:Threonine aldolase n=1 Tax=Streptosporangium becharense TaxID=1816182 RepID=A0A7W9IP65_9ACTN|nr:beta-eliminating lyase-related protein [Streptosporangium becharense]MBB2914324.1 threonine aldolase [Streptosporangium becharense]MBB5823644.1 threonine aldolase [Streptosporangium becharense]